MPQYVKKPHKPFKRIPISYKKRNEMEKSITDNMGYEETATIMDRMEEQLKELEHPVHWYDPEVCSRVAEKMKDIEGVSDVDIHTMYEKKTGGYYRSVIVYPMFLISYEINGHKNLLKVPYSTDTSFDSEEILDRMKAVRIRVDDEAMLALFLNTTQEDYRKTYVWQKKLEMEFHRFEPIDHDPNELALFLADYMQIDEINKEFIDTLDNALKDIRTNDIEVLGGHRIIQTKYDSKDVLLINLKYVHRSGDSLENWIMSTKRDEHGEFKYFEIDVKQAAKNLDEDALYSIY